MLITTVTHVTPQRYRVLTINNNQSCNENGDGCCGREVRKWMAVYDKRSSSRTKLARSFLLPPLVTTCILHYASSASDCAIPSYLPIFFELEIRSIIQSARARPLLSTSIRLDYLNLIDSLSRSRETRVKTLMSDPRGDTYAECTHAEILMYKCP
jgi:hypothetical protein